MILVWSPRLKVILLLIVVASLWPLRSVVIIPLIVVKIHSIVAVIIVVVPIHIPIGPTIVCISIFHNISCIISIPIRVVSAIRIHSIVIIVLCFSILIYSLFICSLLILSCFITKFNQIHIYYLSSIHPKWVIIFWW